MPVLGRCERCFARGELGQLRASRPRCASSESCLQHSVLRWYEERTSCYKDCQMLKKLVLAFALGGLALSASACNTVKGAGQDIESVGQAGDDAIN